MGLIVILASLAPGGNGRIKRLHPKNWDTLLTIARANGWQPQGTTPAIAWRRQWERRGTFCDDYSCSDFGKTVTGEDAASLAAALARAIQRVRTGDLKLDCDTRPCINSDYLVELFEFVGSGSFSFVWDD